MLLKQESSLLHMTTASLYNKIQFLAIPAAAFWSLISAEKMNLSTLTSYQQVLWNAYFESSNLVT